MKITHKGALSKTVLFLVLISINSLAANTTPLPSFKTRGEVMPFLCETPLSNGAWKEEARSGFSQLTARGTLHRIVLRGDGPDLEKLVAFHPDDAPQGSVFRLDFRAQSLSEALQIFHRLIRSPDPGLETDDQEWLEELEHRRRRGETYIAYKGEHFDFVVWAWDTNISEHEYDSFFLLPESEGSVFFSIALHHGGSPSKAENLLLSILENHHLDGNRAAVDPSTSSARQVLFAAKNGKRRKIDELLETLSFRGNLDRFVENTTLPVHQAVVSGSHEGKSTFAAQVEKWWEKQGTQNSLALDLSAPTKGAKLFEGFRQRVQYLDYSPAEAQQIASATNLDELFSRIVEIQKSGGLKVLLVLEDAQELLFNANFSELRLALRNHPTLNVLALFTLLEMNTGAQQLLKEAQMANFSLQPESLEGFRTQLIAQAKAAGIEIDPPATDELHRLSKGRPYIARKILEYLQMPGDQITQANITDAHRRLSLIYPTLFELK